MLHSTNEPYYKSTGAAGPRGPMGFKGEPGIKGETLLFVSSPTTTTFGY